MTIVEVREAIKAEIDKKMVDTISYYLEECDELVSLEIVGMVIKEEFTNCVNEIIKEMEFEDEDDFEEPYYDECGFDPYMGCYSYDC